MGVSCKEIVNYPLVYALSTIYNIGAQQTGGPTMWDRHSYGSCSFSEAEVLSLLGKKVLTSACEVVELVDSHCYGPDAYLMVDTKDRLLYKTHNNCPYLVKIIG